MNSDQAITTIAENRAVGPLGVNEEEVRPMYVWKTGRTFYPSRKETVVAEAFLKRHRYADCVRALEAIGVKKNWLTCQRWLGRKHVQEWIGEQMEERGLMAGWTEGRWVKVMTDHLTGRVRLQNGDLYAMKLIADVRGFKKVDGAGYSNNVLINFTERAA